MYFIKQFEEFVIKKCDICNQEVDFYSSTKEEQMKLINEKSEKFYHELCDKHIIQLTRKLKLEKLNK